LVLACSQAKWMAAGKVRAVDRYEGPAFKVLRKFLREAPGAGLRTYILSAEHGLMPAGRGIEWYDRRMTRLRADELRAKTMTAFGRLLRSREWSAVGVCVGKDYELAMKGIDGATPAGVAVDWIRGGLGPRLTALKAWLYGGARC
jgi:hypothetical protein